MDNLKFADAQQAQAFLLSQLTHIEQQVYKIKYPGIRYPTLIPIDTSANPWVPSVTYFSTDGAGQAQWFAGGAHDMAHADVNYNKFETSVQMAGIGYRYDTEELAIAQMMGRNLTADKAAVARQAAEKFIDQVALFGDAKVGFTGLVNNAAVTTITAPATGTGSATTWASKTPDLILADINSSLLSPIYIGTLQIEMADTLLLPIAQWEYLATTRLNAQVETTILDWVRTKNVYSAETGQSLMIRSVRGLETAGAGSSARVIAYAKDPGVLKMHLPMPFRFMPAPWQVGPMLFEVPGIFRFGGVDVRKPAGMRYMDGV